MVFGVSDIELVDGDIHHSGVHPVIHQHVGI